MKRSEIQKSISDLESRVRDFNTWRLGVPATYTINRMQEEINTLYKILIDAGLIEAIPKVSGDYRVQNIHFKLKEKE